MEEPSKTGQVLEKLTAGVPGRTRTAEAVGEEIRSLKSAMQYVTLWFAVEIGRRLTEARELVAHGDWLEWLKTETGFSQSTASRYMTAYREYGADQKSLFGAETKYATLNNLSISNALRLLAVPEEEREEFALEVDAEHLSARDLEQAIRERDEARKAEKKEKERADKAELLERDLQARVKELESRPVEVAVEVDQKAIDAAVKEAEEKAEKQAALKKRAEEAEKQAREAEKRAREAEQKAGEAKADSEGLRRLAEEAEKAREEAEALRKKLAMSGEGIVNFRVSFQAWKTEHQQLARARRQLDEALEAFTCAREQLDAHLSALDGETQEKFGRAIRAQVKAWGDEA